MDIVLIIDIICLCSPACELKILYKYSSCSLILCVGLCLRGTMSISQIHWVRWQSFVQGKEKGQRMTLTGNGLWSIFPFQGH